MFNWIINAIAGNYNETQIKLFLPTVTQINSLYDEMDSLSEEKFKSRTIALKETIQSQTRDLTKKEDIEVIVNQYLIEGFALVKQACKRLIGTTYTVKGNEQVWNMIPYDVQIIGWLNLHHWKISEMKTGEGKTLVATMPAYLNALSGKWVHIVTVNDYLASRDSEQMRIVFEYLGLSVWSVVKSTPLHLRRSEYAKDITYVENSELGFDYLRDNLTKSLHERNVLRRPLHYAIVDEVDSILIDESRTPLIISEPDSEPTEKYAYYAQIITLLAPSKKKKKVSKWFLYDMLNENKKEDSGEEEYGDYYVDEKTKSVSLSSEGIAKLEQILNVDNLYKDLWFEEIHHIENALKAQACYNEGKEYLINNGEILIVDENTGRTQPGRRFSQWLHQAIEAKEKVTIQRESKTLATITYQNFFKIYKKLSGMTGTATTEGEEFDSIYNLHVLAIPTNKEIIRVDHNDRVYFNQNAKWKHVIDHIIFAHRMGQPLLIGTSSIQTSELVSSLLTQQNITHSVLNAKFHEQEANIIARAGKYGSVVVATNMAWRGTDIKLEAELNQKISSNYAQWMFNPTVWVIATVYSEDEFNLTIDALVNNWSVPSEDTILNSYKSEQTIWNKIIKINLNTKKKFPFEKFAEIIIRPKESLIGQAEVYDLHYGLGIIGTEKHESRRIDNQLRGRAGRQGDPGMSVFYVALDDTIMRKMGGEKIQWVASLLLPKSELETLALTQSQFTNSIIRAQKQMEWRHFGIRKHLFDYDSVIDKQRQSVYKKRDNILFTLEKHNTNEKWKENNEEDTILNNIIWFVESSINQFIQTQKILGITGMSLIENINQEFWLGLSEEHLTDTFYHSTSNHIAAHIISKFKDVQEIIGEGTFNTLCGHVYLNTIDKNWIEHIDEMQYLREKVGFMGYAQLDPLVMYKKESYEKYQTLLQTIEYTTTVTLANTDFQQVAERMKQPQQFIINEEKASEDNLLNNLKSISTTIPNKQQSILAPQITRHPTTTWEFEITELTNDNQHHITATTTHHKLRPNDKINIRYQDWKTLWDVKYKTVKDDIQQWLCKII